MSKPDSVPMDFKRFVHGIEENVHVYIKLVFSSVDEIRSCANYYFERAILRPELAPKFAEYAAKVYFVAPENEDVNFRKALIAESQKQLDQFMERLNSASHPMTVEHAIGVIQFYGELYNVGFIFKGIVKKYLDIFEIAKHECLISNRCYGCLITTVKKRVMVMAEEDYGVVIQSLVKKIEEYERNPLVMQEANKAPEIPRTFEQLFPPLNNGLPAKDSNVNLPLSFDEKIALFKFLLDELNKTNSQLILKKINESKKIKFDEEMWEVFYEILIEHGITKPDLAEAVVDLCQKLPRGRAEAWQGMKLEDCKVFIIQLINLKIKKLFDGTTANSELVGVMNMLQKLMEHSYYSIGSIATTIDVILSCTQQDQLLTAKVLMQLFAITKKYINTKKIQKLPEKVRKQVLHVIKSGQNGKLSQKGQTVLRDIEEYLGVEREEDDVKTNGNQYDPSRLNGNHHNEASKSNGNHFNPVVGRMTPDKTNGFMSSPKSSPIPHETESFDYSRFVDEQLSTSDFNMMKKSIQTVSSTVRGWDLNKLAKCIFEKSVHHGDHIRFIRYSVLVNNEVFSVSSPFKQILSTVAISTFESELANPNPIQDRTAMAMAEFISELFKIDWITNTIMHRCISLIASDQFESIRRIKILHALIKPPTALKIRKIPYDDSLIFYAKKIQARTVSITDYECHLLCMDVSGLLEKIATQSDDIPITMSVHKPPTKIDMIASVMNNFNDYIDCAKRIKSMNISESDEMNFLVDTIITQIMTNTDQVTNYAKLALELSDIPVIAPNGSINLLKSFLVSKCQNRYLASFASAIDVAQAPPIFALTHFIADLYKLDLVNEEFLKPCIEVLFRNERNCPNTVFCISILFQSIGLKVETKSKLTLSRFFTFFEAIVNNENSYRSSAYGKLIEMRSNNWVVLEEKEKEEVKQSEVKINFKDLGDRKVMEPIVTNLKQHLKTSKQTTEFIKAILSLSLADHSSILNCAKLFKQLIEISPEADLTFSEILMRSLQSEFEKFSRKQNLDQSEKNAFANLINLAGELYREDIFSDEDLHTWLLAKQVNQVSLENLAHLSLIISPKIQKKGSKHLKTVLGMVENIIHEVTMDACFGIKKDLTDLVGIFQSFKAKEVHHERKSPSSNGSF